MLENIFRRCGSKGQVLLFFAFMIPIAFMFVAAASEFGWWYFNQSRLQNAADAAVLAAVESFEAENRNDPVLKHYHYDKFINNWDAEFEKFAKMKTTDTPSRVLKADGTEYKSYIDVKKYVKANMPDSEAVILDEPYDAGFVHDSKTFSDYIYYRVILSGTVNHIFGITESFGEMPIKAVALVRLEPKWDEQALLDNLLLIENGDAAKNIAPIIMYDWERTKAANGNNTTIPSRRTIRAVNRNIEYTPGDTWRVETIWLDGEKTGINIGDGRMENTGDLSFRGISTQLDKNTNRYKLDDMFLDFRPDVNYKGTSGLGFETDWDLTLGTLKGLNLYNNQSLKDGGLYRILVPMNFDEPYPVRPNTYEKNGKTIPITDVNGQQILDQDPLYARIESEPIYGDGITSGHSTVRQIILNINCDNTTRGSDGKYMYRPIVFFYDGPEKLPGSTSTVRDSLPVILNLNADFRGILFMPNSPVVINGNGHKFYGLVVAKSFKHTKTAEDFEGFKEFTDANGHTILINEDAVKTRADIAAEAAANDQSAFEVGDKFVVVENGNGQNIKDAAEFDTTSFVSPMRRSNNNTDRKSAGKGVYVRKTKIDDAEVVVPKHAATSQYGEFVKREEYQDSADLYKKANDDNSNENKAYWKEVYKLDKAGRLKAIEYPIYALGNVDEDILFEDNSDLTAKGSWTIRDDIVGEQKIVRKNFDQKLEKNAVLTYDTKVTDKAGNVYYVDKAKAKYYTQYDMNGTNVVWLDNKGNVQYQEENIEPKKQNKYYERYRSVLQPEDELIFDYEKDFNLSESHFDRFANEDDGRGVVPKRRTYEYLDLYGYEDNFYTYERAEWIM